jgi:hypothetical protein
MENKPPYLDEVEQELKEKRERKEREATNEN